MTRIAFRDMTLSDVPRVGELERICFRSPWSEAALRDELRNKLAHYQVMTIDERIEGYAGMWVFLGEAHITNVAVAPEYRHRGLGRQLMLRMMQIARQSHANAMTLEVRESNIAAQALYFQLGFAKAGVRKRYYSDTGEAAWILWNRDIQTAIDTFPAT